MVDIDLQNTEFLKQWVIYGAKIQFFSKAQKYAKIRFWTKCRVLPQCATFSYV